MNLKSKLNTEPLKSIVTFLALIIIVAIGVSTDFHEIYYFVLITFLIIVMIFSYKRLIKPLLGNKMIMSIRDSNKNNGKLNWICTITGIIAIIKLIAGIVTGSIDKNQAFNDATIILIGVVNLVTVININYITNKGLAIRGSMFVWNEVKGWNWDEQEKGVLNICVEKYGVLEIKDKNYRFIVEQENIDQVNRMLIEFLWDKCSHEGLDGV